MLCPRAWPRRAAAQKLTAQKPSRSCGACRVADVRPRTRSRRTNLEQRVEHHGPARREVDGVRRDGGPAALVGIPPIDLEVLDALALWWGTHQLAHQRGAPQCPGAPQRARGAWRPVRLPTALLPAPHSACASCCPLRRRSGRGAAAPTSTLASGWSFRDLTAEDWNPRAAGAAPRAVLRASENARCIIRLARGAWTAAED